MLTSDTYSVLTQAKFANLIASGKPIENAILLVQSLETEDLTDQHFINCKIEEGSTLDSVDLRDTHWKACQFLDCSFKNCDLRQATFENCDFYHPETRAGANFRFSDLSNCEFSNCDLRLTHFPNAELFCVSFQSCKMSGTGFEKCDFGKVLSKRALKPRASFLDCQLTYANLSDLDLEECTLTDCNLSGANLENTILRSANLKNSSLSDTETDRLDLSYADLRGGQVGALQLRSLKDYRGLIISASQQHLLLNGLGIKVDPD
ncbi:pentapeptide repeat-containing protein [Pseudovibrio sp. Tun.PSC04-5.I4]|uniref:pentapeptide repeat-containing protein n=1 Tax=Pseudovibrio sp. Tun.PSC04-5.I4 TaxID=1798213 RepID=UPI00088EF771|nr:pentapeptide repeat-containing protein [Pseudovibrio sp. Tun.PSC04-5.I4]SDR47845.1 fluoroquinolone resistance protein [Pseudovibrio sp. Tun.PSC04-5.I4]